MKKIFFPLIAVLVLMGCSRLGMYEPPYILDKGKTIVGAGIPAIYLSLEDGSLLMLPIPELYSRNGIGHGMDVGLKAPYISSSDYGTYINFAMDLRKGIGKPNSITILSLGFIGIMESGGHSLFYLNPSL